MNDPRESHPWAFGGINVPLERLFPDYYSHDNHIDCQMKFGQLIKDRFQVICFSGAQQLGWNNEMMWAHYADRQQGVCLEFDENKLSASIIKYYPNVRFELRPVSYDGKANEKPWVHWNEQISKEENLSNFLEVLGREVVFNKSHFWEKEDEKRLLFLNHSDRLFVPFADSLKAVHIGLGIPRPLHEGIYQAIAGKGIKLYVMIYQHDRYERWVLSKKDMRLWTSRDDGN